MLLMSLNNIAMSFADRELFSGVTFDVYDDDRIGLVGVNGCGKTTLFRLLKGEHTSDEGEIHIAGSCKMGFMEQFSCKNTERTVFDEALTVFDWLEDMELELEELHDKIDAGNHSADVIERQTLLTERFEREGGLTYKSRTASALTGLGFSESDFKLSVGVLSGGQKSKLQLAKLLLSNANLLLLDEPTNHLDIKSVEWLERFLNDYRGAYIVISHDRYFLDKVTNRTLELENCHLDDYKGAYTRFLQLKAEEMERRRKVYDSTVKEIKRIEGIIDQQKHSASAADLRYAGQIGRSAKIIGRGEIKCEGSFFKLSELFSDAVCRNRAGADRQPLCLGHEPLDINIEKSAGVDKCLMDISHRQNKRPLAFFPVLLSHSKKQHSLDTL